MAKNFSETDMYEPIKTFFQSLGYEIHGEVKNCDITMLKGDRLIVIEMKKSFGLPLIYQAIDRLSMAEEVYMAIPRMKSVRGKKYRNIINLTKRLGLGLITIAMDSPVKTIEILVFPDLHNDKKNKALKETLVNEINNRTFDLNKGGSTKKKILTAYREKVIKIACVLYKYGDMSAADLVKIYDCDIKSRNILYTNSYGWFKRVKHGIYGLTEKGKKELHNKEFLKLTDYYKNNIH